MADSRLKQEMFKMNLVHHIMLKIKELQRTPEVTSKVLKGQFEGVKMTQSEE
jgi:hypothetical protein